MIYHIAQKELWNKAQASEFYSVDSLKKDGFIHCSTKDQLLLVANHLFKGQKDLVVLSIDEDTLSSKVVFEDLYDYGDEFPHIYGKIDLTAVTRVSDFTTDVGGDFILPSVLE